MLEILAKQPENGVPFVYVTIHEGCSGWNSAVWRWSPLDEGETMYDGSAGFYEPQVTGFTNTSLGTGLREDAIAEARNWAESEGLPLWIPPDGEPLTLENCILSERPRMAQPAVMTHWECFRDAAYYDLWAVRPADERRWGHCFHVQTREEADGLVELLNELHGLAGIAPGALKAWKGDDATGDQ